MTVITRFAPSPTGKLHIGGARTALFNFLFSKTNNGLFYVRIENTDQSRNSNENVNSIIEGLRWLNIKNSKKILYQSEFLKNHQNTAYKLLKEEKAYKCFLDKQELNELREKSRKTGSIIRSPYREKKNWSNSKDGYVIRLKMPNNGQTTIDDTVQGSVSVKNEILDDMVLLRKDQTPTYMLASVVDDFYMKITHVIRGDDHFNNAFRQIQLIKYLNWPIPVYSHIPLIHGIDGSKLSKRTGSNNLLEYREMGFEPEAVNNYLLRLGYSLKEENFLNLSDQSFKFELNKINKAPSRFDETKILNINANYLRKLNTKNLLKKIIKNYNLTNKMQINMISDLIPELMKRYKFLKDIESDLHWINNKKKVINLVEELDLIDYKKVIKNIYLPLSNCIWELNDLKACIDGYLKDNNKKMSFIAPILRTALTGKKFAPDIFVIMRVLGKNICLNRLKNLK